MALQVWLPLTGDLIQQGLSGVEAVNNGATVNNDGKLGKCYQFDGNDYITLPIKFLGSDYSYSVWVYTTSASTTQTLGCCRATVGNGFSLFLIDGKIRIDPGGKNVQWITNYTYPINTWFHIAITCNNGKIKYYINGEYKQEYNMTLNESQWGTLFSIGASQANGSGYGNYLTGQLNDIRIYDHCLSTKEIKELSKGLILHYKLDKIKQTLINAYTYPTFNTSSASAGWNHWGRTNAVGTSGQNQDKQYIFRPNQQYSHWVANASTAPMSTGGYLCYQSPAFEGGYRSIQCIVKEENSLPITEEIVMPAWNGRDGGAEQNIWTSVESLGNGFYLCKCEGIHQSGSNDLIGFYVGPGYKVYFSEAYCEDDREKCTDIFSLDDFELDCSGYKNNGTPTSNLTLSTDTPRYSASTYFPSGTTFIAAGRSAMVRDAITVNLWIKFSTWGNPISCTEGGGWNFENASGIQFSLYIASVGYKPVNSGVATNTLKDNWHMLTGTCDRESVKIYIDGELKGTTSTGSTNLIGYNGANGIFIGAEAAGTTTNPASTAFIGNISDVRIYATALSEEDILELYHTVASIDKQGNLFCGEVVE